MDSVIRSDVHFQEHTGEMTHKTSQPTEDIILNRNAELRKNPNVIQDLGAQSGNPWGRQVASIPMILFEKAKRDGYELESYDKNHAAQEMNRFLQSPEGKTCLVQG